MAKNSATLCVEGRAGGLKKYCVEGRAAVDPPVLEHSTFWLKYNISITIGTPVPLVLLCQSQ